MITRLANGILATFMGIFRYNDQILQNISITLLWLRPVTVGLCFRENSKTNYSAPKWTHGNNEMSLFDLEEQNCDANC